LAAGFESRLLYNEVNFTVMPGEFVVITGENGCGKTTLVKILLGLLPAVAGEIHVMGCRVGTPEWKKIRKKVSYVNQQAVTADFPVTAREVVGIGAVELSRPHHEKKQLVLKSMESMNCLHLQGSPYSVLSGGEKQRVSLARCLCQQPSILVLDEPSSYLDKQSKKDLLLSLERLNREDRITVIMVSHEFHETHAGKWKIVHMENGTVDIRDEDRVS